MEAALQGKEKMASMTTLTITTTLLLLALSIHPGKHCGRANNLLVN